MATTTMGQTTGDVTGKGYNKGLYWGIAAVLAVLLIFAFNTNKTKSVVIPTKQENTSPTNSMMSAPDTTIVSPQSDTTNNNGLEIDPKLRIFPLNPATNQEPRTSVSPDAPKGEVVK